MRAMQFKTQASSACSGTWLWLKTMFFLGSIAAGDEGRRDLARVVAQRQRVLRHGDGVQIDDAVEAVVGLLQLDEFDDRAEIVAKMQIAGGLHAGKDALGEAGHVMRRLREAGGPYGNGFRPAQVRGRIPWCSLCPWWFNFHPRKYTTKSTKDLTK